VGVEEGALADERQPARERILGAHAA
jgi:hypothetical protein